MSDIEQPIESGITRRDLLKRGTVLGGALAWGAPVVQIIGMNPALAAQTSPTCPNLYCVKAEMGEPANAASLGVFSNCGESRGRGSCLDTSGLDLELAPSTITDDFIAVDDDCGVKIYLPLGCTLAGEDNETGSPGAFLGGVSAAAKCGNKGGDPCDGVTDSGQEEITVNGETQTRTFVCFSPICSNGTSISHIEIILCCPDTST